MRAIAGESALDADGRVWFLNGKHAPYRVEDLTEPFPEGRVPTVAKMFGYLVFTVLADDGSVYYRTGEEKDGSLIMERVADLPPVREWTTLDGTSFAGFCDVVRALGEDDRAYAIRVEMHFHENGKTPTYTMHARPYGANVRHLYGSLMERSDREVVETGMTVAAIC